MTTEKRRGRPRLPKHLKRSSRHLTLPKWVWDEIDAARGEMPLNEWLMLEMGFDDPPEPVRIA